MDGEISSVRVITSIPPDFSAPGRSKTVASPTLYERTVTSP